MTRKRRDWLIVLIVLAVLIVIPATATIIRNANHELSRDELRSAFLTECSRSGQQTQQQCGCVWLQLESKMTLAELRAQADDYSAAPVSAEHQAQLVAAVRACS